MNTALVQMSKFKAAYIVCFVFLPDVPQTASFHLRATFTSLLAAQL